MGYLHKHHQPLNIPTPLKKVNEKKRAGIGNPGNWNKPDHQDIFILFKI
jgi:hypothetical protein